MGFINKEKFSLEVGKRIKEYRARASLSQEELAHACEMYRTYVGHLENGRYSPSAYILMKIAKSLKTPIENLYP